VQVKGTRCSEASVRGVACRMCMGAEGGDEGGAEVQ
jgi:hypothetical protein